MVVYEAEEDGKPDKSPNWAEKYLGSDHHTDRLMRTVVGLEDESCVRHHWYEDTKWPIYNKAQVEQSRRAASETLHVPEEQDGGEKGGDAEGDTSTFLLSHSFFGCTTKNNKEQLSLVLWLPASIDLICTFCLIPF